MRFVLLLFLLNYFIRTVMWTSTLELLSYHANFPVNAVMTLLVHLKTLL